MEVDGEEEVRCCLSPLFMLLNGRTIPTSFRQPHASAYKLDPPSQSSPMRKLVDKAEKLKVAATPRTSRLSKENRAPSKKSPAARRMDEYGMSVDEDDLQVCLFLRSFLIL
jgi:hypothetical protein